MKKILSSFVAAGLMVSSACALAQNAPANRFYAELGHTWLNLKVLDGIEAKPTAIRTIVGYDLHPNFAVEGLLAFGASDGTADIAVGSTHVGVGVSLDRAIAVYAKPKWGATPDLELFARLGWAEAKLKASAGRFSYSGSDNDFSYGVGASYRLDKNWQASLDYMSYYGKNSSKFTGMTLGVGYRF